jgi:polyhydroxybutyrate depolymerase
VNVSRVALRALLTAVLLTTSCATARSEGTRELSVDVGGETRSYRLFVPSSAAETAPLVIVLHGSGGMAEDMEGATGYDAVASREHFLVAYAQGLHRNWNAGQALTRGANSDDVAFLVALVEDVGGRHAVDKRRVFLTGHSAGGWMAYRAGCERADVFAAVVGVSTTLLQLCRPSRALPVLQAHGLEDRVLGVTVGGNGVEQMRKVDACPSPSRSTPRQGVTIVRSFPCRDGSEVVWVTVAGVGHVWPIASQGFSATEAGWEFFSHHPLPSA